MDPKKILFVTQEINPYVPESLLTKLGRNLPLASIESGRETRAFMPKWGNINERRNQLHEVIRLSGINIIVDDVDHPLIIKVASVTGTRMQVYFIDNEDFFAKRLEECDDKGKEYTDNFERSVFYARGVLETVKKLRWQPDVIHCQGWISSTLPLLLKVMYADEPCFRNTRAVYTITDNKLTLNTEGNICNILGKGAEEQGLAEEFGQSITPRQMEMLAIKYADGISFAQETPDQQVMEYAQSMKKPILMDAEIDAQKHLDFFNTICAEHTPENN